MPEDRSLDEFAPAGSGEDDPEVEDGSGGDDPEVEDGPGEDGSNGHDPAEIEPAESTSTWSADGADCDRCGATVERRWRDDDGFVCADCAEW
ncbi:DUF7573 domain-containing protein [Halorubrum aethiopicum]|uniref:DUF7573 domain-containing protein n=1 Tax=Halorubrum aethiopicum TaxID=1758255 RepID=UPI000831DFA9|nr:hypothetical protein [Halorubrum aethiopicum]